MIDAIGNNMKVLIDGIPYAPRPELPTGKGFLDALDVRFEPTPVDDELSVREYLHNLLATLWREKDGFSSKRPFGSSDWDLSLVIALAEAGFVDLGPLHPIDKVPYKWTAEQMQFADAYVADLIAAMCFGVS